MKERPILFKAEMVNAILAGIKTQTRRPIKPLKGYEHHNTLKCGMPHSADPWCVWWHGPQTDRVGCSQECPYGKPGDRLWVKETWGFGTRPCPINGWRDGIEYRADQAYLLDDDDLPLYDIPKSVDRSEYSDRSGWRPSIFMPRWASRIVLEITNVRAERLNQISEEDARAEGITDGGCLSCGMPEPCGCDNPRPSPREGFAELWQSIHGYESWAADPWVWAVGFKLVSIAGKAVAQ